jgi:glycosyltransferase involved in cell wall biosynthesis
MKDVTVIIPCYNEARFIEKAIRSAVSQAEFVIVSDNCSTDGTQEICKPLAKEFGNLVFYEQSKNLGSVKNGEFLYSKVQTEYVMTMGAHDILAENYVYELKKCLDENPDAVMAYAPVSKIDDDDCVFGEYTMADIADGIRSSDRFKRVYTIIEKLSDCSIVFGLMRTKPLLLSLDFTPVAAVDHIILCNLASFGKFLQSSETRFFRRFITRDNSKEAYIKRIVGLNNINRYDMSYLCQKQYEIVCRIQTINSRKKIFYTDLAKEVLRQRWGRVCPNDTIEKLQYLKAKGEKFLVYGSGSGADMVLDFMPESVVCLVDKDFAKHGSIKRDILIEGIDEIFKYPTKRIIISVLGSAQVIMRELFSFGVEYERLISLDILDEVDGSDCI